MPTQVVVGFGVRFGEYFVRQFAILGGALRRVVAAIAQRERWRLFAP
jgi:hypothetical protein